jgi:Spy/CpxP family protein refolding chaperone
MTSKNVVKQIAAAAGFLALTFAPAISRAQSNSQQPPAQNQTTPATPAPAQPRGRKHGAMAGLNLTDDQKAQFKKIHDSTKSQVDAVKTDESLSFDQKTAKIHELRRDARMQMVKLLTPEQRQQMRANIREMRAARREKEQPQQQAQPQG